jgi:hypothetical protein
MLRKISGYHREATGGWRKWHNGEPHFVLFTKYYWNPIIMED